jgi:hypothetical protein
VQGALLCAAISHTEEGVSHSYNDSHDLGLMSDVENLVALEEDTLMPW